ncbi:RagB/SusD family nutrient uptake outer membrane protein [Chitinophaga sp. SYP-B3965]|uniref:RagB/SusD family nutrient uptake outer membrane protein n=1 Tax=Chitinophaga sp. SYP-B3965 TaxID=2663120 RepID=UPI001299EB25|nr:RagB/SusD family nutrient uptake outer membrane protein [Chitinophaga sp. SYP-B3965]MRG47288.1 RagB/SusD family nutrient uptake outer membrane protein [Chitinophaga sp. SYP-B3965]
MRINIILTGLFLCVCSTGCLKEVSPSDAITSETLITTPDGLKNAVNGSYSLFKDHVSFNGTVDVGLMYLRNYYHLSDFSSDDITCGQVTTDPLWYSFTLTHSPAQSNTRFFWYISYKIINNSNAVIEAGEKISNPDAATQQLIGESYFLRAFCHFNLVRLFAKPYSQDPAAAGIILRTSLSDPSQKKRATVAEVYDAVIADAEKAATLMNQSRGVSYANKEAAWALLSRVYLYKEDNAKAIAAADKVISSGKFSLTDAITFPQLFRNAQGSTETIFCIAFTPVDDYGKNGSVASMLYSDGNSGWGEEFASSSLRDVMAAHPEDVRWSYISPRKDAGGNVVKMNGIETYYITKYSFQGGSPTLSSPVMFRLAEVYLNRAEAKAKSNMTPAALDDVDEIRKKRGLTASLYNKQLPAGRTVLDVVLQERRMELAFEGHRNFDVYRNKLSMNRTYWGYHLAGLQETDVDLSKAPVGYTNMVVNWNSPRTIFYIPVDEIQANPLCTQNP